jgi:CHASE1-domain containing sensor protein/predicted Ser/Thr protein kinase
MSGWPVSPSSTSRRRGISGTFRTFADLRLHTPALLAFALCALGALAMFFWFRGRVEQTTRVAFEREATLVVSNLRSALERPLEVLEASGTLFEASREVTRSEFATFVKPALERHPGVRALEWIPIVPGVDRARYEASARADGITGYEFRQYAPDGQMVSAESRSEYLPIYYMEPGHPLVLGFDCASDAERRSIAERARRTGSAAASERIRLLDDPPSVSSIVTFRPVYDTTLPRSPAAVRGFTCEVFRVPTVVERAIDESIRRGLEVALLDPAAPPKKQLLFESSAALATRPVHGPRYESTLRYADRDWRLLLATGAAYRADADSPAWLALIAGLAGGALLGLSISAFRIIRRLRRQVRSAQTLGQYTVLEKLGQGGVGVVHKAQHGMLRRPTAIKFLAEQSSDPKTLARFEREVQLTSELTHPNTIAVYDYGRTPDGVFYYVMEYIDGVNLEQLVQQEGRLPPGRVVHLLEQACRSLAEAHGIGLIHRDIKPGNLMICERGAIPDFVKVMDFGLVKNVAGVAVADPVTETATASVIGTPLYLAPEAITNPHGVDGRADIYALGAVAYFLLVGDVVFRGQTVVDVCTQHLYATPQSPSQRLGFFMPSGLEALVMRCLSKDPASRFPDAGALLEALSRLTDVEPWSEQQAREWWRARGKSTARAAS